MDTKRLREILDNLSGDLANIVIENVTQEGYPDREKERVELIDQAIKEIQELSTPRLTQNRCSCGESIIPCCPACGDITDQFVKPRLMEECNKCGGTGKRKFHEVFMNGKSANELPCAYCRGTGKKLEECHEDKGIKCGCSLTACANPKLKCYDCEYGTGKKPSIEKGDSK